MASRVFPRLEFMDRNSLYLNDEITIHCGGMWMSVDEIPAIEDTEERAAQTKAFCADFKDAKEMIEEESGLKQINKLFRSISKPKYSSRLIDYYRELQTERRRKQSSTDE